MYHALDVGMIRASVVPVAATMPSWPTDSADPAQLRTWVGEIWANPSWAEAIAHAAPTLAQAVHKVLDGTAQPSRIESCARSLARYLLRMQYRTGRSRASTPTGSARSSRRWSATGPFCGA
ncbi:Lantibiotic dehydratase, C terminus [Actinacidiphila guanduensis]|uniref:Lantibiotic dehydratase, C terminus n=1 Tax=Actinacidiphila guanduensis TaxID=310781 RepID=A0A1G9Y8Z1_9ACTN|nr:Lantibiotic dehydratase, C terminus [Actinacidiphila guanduensis]